MIYAASSWSTNAELICALRDLGYLRADARTLDPTWGKGSWWKLWQPDELVRHDRDTLDGVDFRKLPEDDDTFDAITYDPPYVCPGGLRTSNIKEMHGRYGMNAGGDVAETARDFRTPAELQTIIDDGLTEMFRVARPKAYVIVACKDYIWSGKFWDGTGRTRDHALALGFELVDRLEHIGTPGPQSQTRQVHARRNLSTKFVFKMPARKRSGALV